MVKRILKGFPLLAFLTQNLAAVRTGDPRHHRVVQASSMILHSPFKAVSVYFLTNLVLYVYCICNNIIDLAKRMSWRD